MTIKEIQAWHGTTQYNAQKIRQEGFNKTTIEFHDSGFRNPNDLGAGVYFYIDSKYNSGQKMAMRYAHQYRDTIAKRQNCSLETLEVNVAIKDSMLLNLDDADTNDIFIEFSKKHESERDRIRYRLTNDGANRRKNYDGIMVELFIRHINAQLRDFEVQAVQKATCTIFDGIISNFPNGVELCVRDTDCIRLKEREKTDHGNEFKRFF